MANTTSFSQHSDWEDWLGMIFGVIAAASPWFIGAGHSQAIMVNALAMGIVLFGLSIIELFDRQRWEQYLQGLVGIWLIVSPYALNYSGDGPLRYWHWVLGVLVLLLAAMEISQPASGSA